MNYWHAKSSFIIYFIPDLLIPFLPVFLAPAERLWRGGEDVAPYNYHTSSPMPVFLRMRGECRGAEGRTFFKKAPAVRLWLVCRLHYNIIYLSIFLFPFCRCFGRVGGECRVAEGRTFFKKFPFRPFASIKKSYCAASTIAAKAADLSEAPPIRPPSTFSLERSSAAFL